MTTRKEGVAVRRLDENRYAISLDRVIRYVGSQAECDRRAAILLRKNGRDVQEQGFGAGLPDGLIARISAGPSAVPPSLRCCKKDRERLKAPADCVKTCESDGKRLQPG
jgi:hypothetical protein